jgi:hypothetical protein
MTPGPWSYDGHGINASSEDYRGDRIFKTCLDYSHGSADRDRAIADSEAVAALPDLIDALYAVLGIENFHALDTVRFGGISIRDVVKAALVKAGVPEEDICETK